ncbi:uncharacterized protein PgNI_02231 [Pyricularia grisea]|uniref:Uncharacterized protein n=1 Tax=Pyricularia grisea TaxID=148305 RepID=A0A6P8BKW4_PYRGI|nr:uncharacterized protein PgNI_02231 [Pyricularia grisea]TLD17334.1 hypothetical protein PgNI_02231 [Pyricularia grisea]
MAPLMKLLVLFVAATPAIAALGKIGTTTNHKGNPLGVGKDLCENIGYTGPPRDVNKRPFLEDCKKLLSNAETMGDNEDSTVVYKDKNRIYWMGKQDVIELLRMVTTGTNIREDRLSARGEAYNCLVTDLEEYPVGKQYMEFLIDDPANFEFPFRTTCQDN